MDSGSLAQMSLHPFGGSTKLAVTGPGLASRRGGQGVKPLSIDATRQQPGVDRDPSAVTPRTSRSHLLAGLRTAPKSATAATFPHSPTTGTTNLQSRNANGLYSASDNVYSGPKTSMPRFPQAQTYGANGGTNGAASTYAQQQQQHYTADQILAPPEIQIDDHDTSSVDTDYAELVATNAYLAAQKQRLQQQLMSVQAAQQQFQTLNLGSAANAQTFQQAAYQQLLFQQQQLQQQQLQQQQLQQQQQQQQQIYAMVDPATGQQTLYVGQAPQMSNHYMDQYNANMQQLQQLQMLQQQLQQQQQKQQQQQHTQLQFQQLQHHQQHQQRQPSPIVAAPRVQVSPPSLEAASRDTRNPSPSRRFEMTLDQHTPLPPPSANAFRRGHKKSTSLVGASNLEVNNALPPTHDLPKSAGPKTTSFPANVMQTGTYGPGQGRAGEHPVRQPRGPPSFDELARMPTSKHEGSKNFATQTRRSAVHNLVRAGFTRRQVTASGSSGSISPISESAEELTTPLTDDESVSGRSGSGSLNGDDVECSLPSSRTSTGSWGAIGSDRPGSREKTATKSAESQNAASDSEGPSPASSFASVFKSAAPSASADGQQRRAPLVLLKSTEKRRCAA